MDLNETYVVQVLIKLRGESEATWGDSAIGSFNSPVKARVEAAGYCGQMEWRIVRRVITDEVLPDRAAPEVEAPASISGPAAKAAAKVLADRPHMATDDVVYVLAGQGIEVSGRTVRRVRQLLREGATI